MLSTMTLCGAGPVLGVVEAAHADGPVRPAHHPAAVRWRQVHSSVVLRTGAPAGPILAGRVYNWPYSVTNAGGPAQGVTFTAPMPATVAFVSAQQNCASTGGQVVCQLGSMQPGETRSGIISGMVLGQAAPGQPITMNGVVSAAVVRQARVGKPAVVKWGPLTTQSSFPVVLTAQTADVAVAKAAPGEVRPGGTVAYRITVRNQGPSLAQNVLLTDLVQAQAPIRVLKGDAACTMTSGTATGGAGSGTGTGSGSGGGASGAGGSGDSGQAGFVCGLGSMPTGGVRKLTVSVQVGQRAAAGAVLKAPAKVTSSTIDLNTANNTANVRTRVVAPAPARAQAVGERAVTGGSSSSAADQAAPAPGISELPRTGEQTGRLVVIALALLAGGALLTAGAGRLRRGRN